jgi:PiT family inorganic phosphate transporter
MRKVGTGIINLTPEAALIVVLAQAMTLFVFSSKELSGLFVSVGLPPIPMVPISSTQAVIGALLGIGMVKGINEINLKSLYGIALGWILTPVVSALLTYFLLFFAQNVFKLPVN